MKKVIDVGCLLLAIAFFLVLFVRVAKDVNEICNETTNSAVKLDLRLRGMCL